tara:strand:- start:397 stop:597 length:201 start_codon:yes stop_codon:yes gene_type:complete
MASYPDTIDAVLFANRWHFLSSLACEWPVRSFQKAEENCQGSVKLLITVVPRRRLELPRPLKVTGT